MEDIPVYKLEKVNFDGPLDLLLSLCEKNKVDILDIPIAEITAQYLDYVRSMPAEDLGVMADFLVMASTLLGIKSRVLLSKDEEEDEPEEDPREELAERLLIYRRCKRMAGELKAYEKEASKIFYRGAGLPEELGSFAPPVDTDALLEGVDLKMLNALYLSLVRRAGSAENTEERRYFGLIKERRISVSECIDSMVEYSKTHRRFTFRQLFGGGAGRERVVASFLAVLELMKAGAIDAAQNDASGDIDITVRDTGDLSGIDLAEIDS